MKEIDSQVCQGLACFRRKENRDHSEELIHFYSPKGRGLGCSAFLSVVPLFFFLGPSWKLQCVYREVLYPMFCQKSQSDKMAQHGRTSYGT